MSLVKRALPPRTYAAKLDCGLQRNWCRLGAPSVIAFLNGLSVWFGARTDSRNH